MESANVVIKMNDHESYVIRVYPDQTIADIVEGAFRSGYDRGVRETCAALYKDKNERRQNGQRSIEDR